MIALLKYIGQYLNHPQLIRIPEKIENPTLLLFRLWLISMSAAIIAGIFGSMLIDFKLIPNPGVASLQDNNLPRIIVVLGPLILGPVIEELIFRAQLRRFTGSLIFISFIAGIILSAILQSLWAFMISPFIFLVIFIIYRSILPKSVSKKFKYWALLFPWHFHFTAICFALVHLANFEKGIALLPYGLLYTLPQLVVGLIFGFTRMAYGLKYSIALHALYNFLPAMVLILKY